MLLKRLSEKDQSPCHRQTLQILLSLLLLFSPQLGQQWWMGSPHNEDEAPDVNIG